MISKHDGIIDFDTFVKRQQPPLNEQEPVDWTRQRDEWLNHLRELYAQIESFLAKYIEIKEIKRSYLDIALNEQNIGSYKAPQMILKIGRQEITLTPVGTLLLGAKGRVDVEGPAGRTRFLLVNGKATGPTIKVTVTELPRRTVKGSISNYGKPEPAAVSTAPEEIKWAWKIATSPPSVQYIDLTPESFFQALMEVANG